MGLQGLLDVVQDLDVAGVVEVLDLEELLHLGHARLGQGRVLGLFVDHEIAVHLGGVLFIRIDMGLFQAGDDPVHLIV